MTRKGIEFTILLIEPGLWKWEFQIGDVATTGKTTPISGAWRHAGLRCESTAHFAN